MSMKLLIHILFLFLKTIKIGRNSTHQRLQTSLHWHLFWKINEPAKSFHSLDFSEKIVWNDYHEFCVNFWNVQYILMKFSVFIFSNLTTWNYFYSVLDNICAISSFDTRWLFLSTLDISGQKQPPELFYKKSCS